jgi:hypothetical protein
MSTKFSLVIDGIPVDLFNDESIVITRQIKDLTELNANKSDFTQQFVIPSSPQNDQIFQNYFDENAVFTGWNAYQKLDAEIFVNGLPIFNGCIELTGVTFRDGLPRQYNIVFYGTTKNAFVEWGEQTLIDVDWSDYEHQVTPANVVSSWTNGLFSGDVVWPIADWFEGYVYSTKYKIVNNISRTDAGGIEINDLRPIMRLRAMVEACLKHLNPLYTLSGTLFDQPQFDQLYIAPMGQSGPIQNPSNDDAKATITKSFFSYSPLTNSYMGWMRFELNTIVSDPLSLWDNTKFEYAAPYNGWYTFEFEVNVGSINGSSGYTPAISFALLLNNYPIQSELTIFSVGVYTQKWKIQLNKGNKISIGYRFAFGGNITTAEFAVTSVPYGVENSTMDMSIVMPPIKITDFVANILKTFNAVMIPVTNTEWAFHNLDDWYQLGTSKDWTQWVDMRDISHNKMAIPKSVSMQYGEGKDLANQEILSKYGRRFGSTYFAPSVDFAAGELKVDSIFTIPVPSVMREINDIGNPIRETDIQMMVMLDKDNKPAMNQLLMMFYNGLYSVNFKYYFAGVQRTQFTLLSPYNAFPTATTTQSLAFGMETTLSGNLPTQTMFTKYWQPYLSRLYSDRSRIVKMTAIIPMAEWLTLEMNQTIAISGNYYKIQSIQYDMLTERANIELITYFDVDIITWSGTGNNPIWDKANEKPIDGLTFLGDDIVALDVVNGRPTFGGDVVTDILGQTNYSEQNVGTFKGILNQLFSRIRKSVLTAYNDNQSVVMLNAENLVVIPLTDSVGMGDTDQFTFDAGNSWVYSSDGGQFRLTGIISHSKDTGNHHHGFAICVDGLKTLAWTTSDKSNESVTLTCVMDIQPDEKIQLMAWDLDGHMDNMFVNNVRLMIEKL